MIPDEQPKAAPEPSEKSAPATGARRRSRRGGRRHSKRRNVGLLGPKPVADGEETPTVATAESESAEEAETISSPPEAEDDSTDYAAEAAREQIQERQPTPQPEPEPEREFKTPGVTGAIEQVTKVIEELKHVVDEMEEVLETLELAERQKIDDEREIESLQRALRQLHRSPSGAGQNRR